MRADFVASGLLGLDPLEDGKELEKELCDVRTVWMEE